MIRITKELITPILIYFQPLYINLLAMRERLLAEGGLSHPPTLEPLA